MIRDLESFAPDLSEDDALRLMLTVEHGYAYPTPMLALLVDLGYLWAPAGNTVLYPSHKGRETALRVAMALLESAMHAGTSADVTEAHNRVTRLQTVGGSVSAR